MTGTTSEDRVEDPAAPARRTSGLAARRIADVLVLLAVALALLLPGLTTLPVTDRDEALFVQATRQMVVSGDFVDARVMAEPTYRAPVLTHWLQAVAVSLGGGLEAPPWVNRLPSLAGAVAAVLLTYATGLALAGRAAGLAAGLLAAATVALGVEARLARTDAALLAAVMAAQWALASLWASPTPARRIWRNAAFWTAIGLGILLGGSVVLLAVVPTLATMLVVDRSWRSLAALDPIRGAAWAALLVVSWVVAMEVLSEGRILAEMIGRDVLATVVTGGESRGAPPGMHAVVAVFTFWPLSAFLPLVFALPPRSRLEAPTRRAIAFLAGWVLPIWIVMEAVPVKPPNHVLPAMPGIAILVGIALAAAAAPAGRPMVRGGFSFVAAGAVILAFGSNAGFVFLEGRAHAGGLAVGLAVILCGFAASWFLLNGRMAAGVAGSVLASGLAAVLAWAILLPSAKGLWLSDRIAEAVESVRPCADPVVMAVRYREPSLVVRLGAGLRFLTVEEAASAYAAADCAVAVVPAEDDATFRQAAGAGEPAATATGRNVHGLEPRTMHVHAKTGNTF